jgi:pyoverdine/dityrosine biosynthesis protein Dit1
MSGLSIYHRFCCAFVRTRNGELISCTGPVQDELRNHWSEIWAAVVSSPLQKSLMLPNTRESERRPHSTPSLSPTIKALIKVNTIQQGAELTVYESREGKHDETVLGVIAKQPYATETESDHVLASLLLSNIRLFTSMPLQDNSEDLTNALVDLFDTRLRFVTANDKWRSHGGREFFFKRVHEFVRRKARLEFCLPAFPCKSSNKDKVSGVMPDRGEQVALQHLDSFVGAIESIYEPGAKLYVVSDGHVFSDCSKLPRKSAEEIRISFFLATDDNVTVGVDDETVNKYNDQLISMYAAISQRRGGKDRIGFKSLNELFKLKHGMAEIKDVLHFSQLQSHISTKRTEEAEFSRQILHQGFKTDEAILRSRIESKDHSTLRLYRGFSRFMLEDLSLNGYTKCLSRSQLRKLSSKVSFEMIKRNEAYSNLVELLFPHHVRLSIHAHDNSGPKFGIRLFGSNVRPLETLSFDGAEMRSVDLLHVPTPWHNCLVEVSGHSTLIMTKSEVVKTALSSGKFDGGWTQGIHQGVAGHFRLQPVDPVKSKTNTPLASVANNRNEESDSDASLCSADAEYATISTTANADLIYMRAYFDIL